jgi:multidrug efflux pump subunit AcrA (membrane-fusion protein)
MATIVSNRRTWTWQGVGSWIALGLALGLGLAFLAATAAHDQLFHRRMLGAPLVEAKPEAQAPSSSAAAPAAQATSVSLPEGKLKTANIQTEPATLSELPTEVSEPGLIEANLERRIDIRPRSAGVVREVYVSLGQQVKKGDLVALLDSHEVGMARIELRDRQRALGVVRNAANWKSQVAANVAELIVELRKGTEAVRIEREYAQRPLGSFRATLLQAYAEFDIAHHEEEKISGLHHEKIVGEHPFFVAKHTRESVQAKFESVLEQVRFDAGQEEKIALNQLRQAEGAVKDAAEHLRLLGIDVNIAALLDPAAQVPINTPDEDITRYPITAPFDGTIIDRKAVPSQKVELSDMLVTLADLSTVWVRANIEESKFAALPSLQGGTVRFSATAYPDRIFQAKLLSIGSVVDPMSRTVPLRAAAENPEGLLKLGMFVRIVLDSSTRERRLTVPASAVIEIEGKSAVFVPSKQDARTFTFHPVQVGREVGNRQVVLAGLAPGDPVVSSGAFTLKSELILQNEPEEE